MGTMRKFAFTTDLEEGDPIAYVQKGRRNKPHCDYAPQNRLKKQSWLAIAEFLIQKTAARLQYCSGHPVKPTTRFYIVWLKMDGKGK